MATDKLSIEVEANTSGVDKLNESLKKLNNQLNRTVNTGDTADTGFKKITKAVDGFARSLEKIDITPIERLAKALEKISAVKFTGTGKQLEKVAKVGENIAPTESLPTDVGTATSGAALPSTASASVGAMGKAATTSTKALMGLGSAMGVVKKAASKMLSPITKVVSVFGRMIMFNVVFRFLMLISDAVNVGITNLYNYSKAWNNIDWTRTQNNMNDLAATAQQMKNTFGVTLMSMLAAAKPILDSIAQAFINAANAINAFMAALNGSATFTKATKQAKEWGEATSGAAKAAKNATTGIDELNIISKDSGGGGGASTPDYSSMFEEVEVPSKIKDFVSWLQDHLQGILMLATLIGAAFLAWKILQALPTSLMSLTNFLWLLVAVLGAVAYAWGIVDAWVNGVDWNNVALMVGGLAAVFVGLWKVFGLTAGAIALVVGAIGMFAVGIHDVMEKGEMTTQTFALLEAASVALGVGLTILLGPIGAIIGAIAGLVTAIFYLEQDNAEFTAMMSEAWERLKGSFEQLKSSITIAIDKLIDAFKKLLQALQPIVQMVINLFIGIVDSIAQGLPFIVNVISDFITVIAEIISAFTALLSGDFDGFFEHIVNALKAFLDSIINIILAVVTIVEGIVDAIVSYVKTILNALKTAIITIVTAIKDKVAEIVTLLKNKVSDIVNAIKSHISNTVNNIKEGVISVVTTIVSTVTNKLNAFKTTVINIFTGIWNGIKKVINTILGGIESMVNGVINGLNKMIDALNSLSFDVPDWVPGIGGGTFGFNIANLNTISIPKLASGGMVEAGQLFIANEAGPELVGSMGGNTTVANNEQIISGIQQGVEIAVSQILAPYLSDIAQNTRETANKDFSVNIGDREIAKANIRGQRSLGRSIISTV